METIKDLFYQFLQNPPTDMPELAEIEKNHTEWVGILDTKTARQAEDYHGATRLHSLEQGFCWGFAYAMRIANECGMMTKGGGAV